MTAFLVRAWGGAAGVAFLLVGNVAFEFVLQRSDATVRQRAMAFAAWTLLVACGSLLVGIAVRPRDPSPRAAIRRGTLVASALGLFFFAVAINVVP